MSLTSNRTPGTKTLSSASSRKPHYRWSLERCCWVLCEGYSPAIHPVVLA